MSARQILLIRVAPTGLPTRQVSAVLQVLAAAAGATAAGATDPGSLPASTLRSECPALQIHQSVMPADAATAKPSYLAYLAPAPSRTSLDDAAFQRVRRAVELQRKQRPELFLGVERLVALMEIAGASVGAPFTHHYVVETDVTPGGDAELNDWYDTEHMPGLAAVPGTVSAARYRNADGEPVYHACYALATPDAFGSPPWLAVRATAWSSRVRPTFVNTRRQMYRTI